MTFRKMFLAMMGSRGRVEFSGGQGCLGWLPPGSNLTPLLPEKVLKNRRLLLDLSEKRLHLSGLSNPLKAVLSFMITTINALLQINDAHVLNLSEGQEMQVKYYGCDPVSGAMRVSRKALTVSSASAVKRLQNSTMRR